MLDMIGADGNPVLDKPHNFVEEIQGEGVGHGWPSAERDKDVKRSAAGRFFLHRKGAAPASIDGAGPDPVVIPGSLGNSSWFCVAAAGSAALLRSVNHGVGRKWSRTLAAEKLREKARTKGMDAVTGNVEYVVKDKDTLFEEGGDAYKDIESVMKHAEGAGLVRRVARLDPLLVVKE